MSKVRVSAFAVSLDGYAAGPHQSLDNPLGVRGPELFKWFFSTRTWKQMHGQEGGSTGVDNEQERGKNILVGGVSVPSQLIELGLIDEYRFVVGPVLAGEGRRLLEGVNLPDKVQLTLVDSKILKSGCVALRYLKQ